MPRFTTEHYVEIASVVRAKLSTHESNSLDTLSAGFHAVSGVAEGLADMFAADNPNFDRLKFVRACGLEAENAESLAQRTDEALSELDALEARIHKAPTQADREAVVDSGFRVLRQIRRLRTTVARWALEAPGATEADHANAKRLDEAYARAEAILTDYTEV